MGDFGFLLLFRTVGDNGDAQPGLLQASNDRSDVVEGPPIALILPLVAVEQRPGLVVVLHTDPGDLGETEDTLEALLLKGEFTGQVALVEELRVISPGLEVTVLLVSGGLVVTANHGQQSGVTGAFMVHQCAV